MGGGVTGCEAAWRAARLGARVTLVTTSLDTVYALDEEPGGLSAPPGTLLQAVLAEGASTRWDVHRSAKYALEAEARLHLLQSTASALVVEDGTAIGVETWEGVPRRAEAVALCVGTFLRARLEIGSVVEHHGRLSEMAYDDLYRDLSERGFEFAELELAAEAGPGSLPHVVRTLVFAAAERSDDDLSLRRLSRLYAAGACVARPDGPPGAVECAAEGARLADVLAGQVGRGSPEPG